MDMTAPVPVSPPPHPAAPPRRALSPVTWVIGLAVVAAVILYFAAG